MKKFDADQPGYGLGRLAAASGETNVHLMMARAADGIFNFHGADTAQSKTSRSLYRKGGKRALETVLVILSLPFFLPVMALCIAALWIEGGNPF